MGTRNPMVKKRAAVEAIKLRKTPPQKRSADTVAVIVEAAARVVELNGFEGFNTNAVAEGAGVSIGSLYQYFPSKDALPSAPSSSEKLHRCLASVRSWSTSRNARPLFAATSVPLFVIRCSGLTWHG